VTPALSVRLRPCGPVLDAAAARRAFEALAEPAARQGWGEALETARDALAPVFAAAPYLAGLATRRPERLGAILTSPPEARLEQILAEAAEVETHGEGPDTAKHRLRLLKGDVHLLTALCDLGGAWDLDALTSALTRFADAALRAALAIAARAEVARGRLAASDGAAGPVPGLFCLAMGKYGAFELNYSSDIDFSIFYEPLALPLAEGVEPQAFAIRLTQTVAELLQARTADGYVFRVDLRLRPDPAATPPAAPIAAALDYYETVGQNWERAALIKARPAAGDLARGRAFLAELEPFVWRRNLDFSAIDDIQSIKRQIHIHKVDERLSARGADVKLGRGGIREIEFYVQTQQLILGGRDPSLRANRTVEALAALARAGVVQPATAEELTGAYGELRALEHRAQMIADEQTHRLPESDADRRRIAALSGDKDLRRFDARVERLLRAVNRRYGELFPQAEDLSSRFGSLVFTGVEDDPETLRTLARMGFSDPARVSATIRAWHHGRIAATRTEGGRELFTRLAPRFLEAAQATGAADTAFKRFADFFERLNSGVQVQSLFLAQPKLFELIVQVMAFAPQLADTLARRPAALDAMLDRAFFDPVRPGEDEAALDAALARAGPGFEAAMNAVRRVHREQAFRIGVQVMSGAASADQAGRAFADLADVCIRALAPASLAETERIAGAFPGEVAVVALGKCGSREMSAGSDLDLMTLYRARAPDAVSAAKGWMAETFYARFTQRLIAALSAPTAEGGLYQVDMRLRPSGTAGPVAVSAAAFETYYAAEAETWELMALTRARVVWASADGFATWVASAIETALRRPRDRLAAARDAREMRALIAAEKPPSGLWDVKLAPGGLVDIEFVAQYLQIVGAADGGPLRPHTAEALAALSEAGRADPAALAALADAWRLQQNITQLLKVALQEDADPAHEPKAFRAALARAAGVRGFASLAGRLRAARQAALAAYQALIPGRSGDGLRPPAR
jgi:glutamate-ammonia-ligase adenylyltransferase